MSTLLEKLLSLTKPSSTGCLEWTRTKTSRGYGCVVFCGKRLNAHRVAWELANNKSPGDLLVCHRCDNPKCINPEHLFLGTVKENALDCVSKGRHRSGNTNKKFCKRGHEFTTENTCIRKSGGRKCRQCSRIYASQKSAKIKPL